MIIGLDFFKSFLNFLKSTPRDWKENDRKSLRYIANRPFYTKDTESQMILNQTFDDFEEYNAYSGEVYYSSSYWHDFPELIEGGTYHVYWDGVKYECVCCFNSYYLTLGNLDLWGKGIDTGEPFLIFYDSYYQEAYIETKSAGLSHTLAIYHVTTEHVTLDEKYLPESISPDWNQNDEAKKSYIKNKPFYEENINRVALDNYKLAYSNADEYPTFYDWWISLELPWTSEYCKVTITLNGTEYKNLSLSDGFIGAPFIGYEDDDYSTCPFDFSEYPFNIQQSLFSDTGSFVISKDIKNVNDLYLTLSLSYSDYVVNKIPDKFQHQSDWDEINPLKAECIVNKPFGEIESEELEDLTDVGSSLAVYVTQEELYYRFSDTSSWYPDIELNKSYTVKFNDTLYENVISFEYTDDFGYVGCALGCSYDEISSSDEPSYPFFVSFVRGCCTRYIRGTYDSDNPDIIVIQQRKVITKQLDEKYIPDTIARTSDIPTTEAYDTHVSDTTIHVTSTEKETWNNKSDFSGSYNDLTDKPDDFTGATSSTDGSSGLVPAPTKTDYTKFLKGDGTWSAITHPQEVIWIDILYDSSTPSTKSYIDYAGNITSEQSTSLYSVHTEYSFSKDSFVDDYDTLIDKIELIENGNAIGAFRLIDSANIMTVGSSAIRYTNIFAPIYVYSIPNGKIHYMCSTAISLGHISSNENYNLSSPSWTQSEISINVFTSGTMAGSMHRTSTPNFANLIGFSKLNSTTEVPLTTESQTLIGAINEVNAAIPTTDDINQLIDAKLGVIENGSY